jgi:hypothetical protein
MPGQHLQPVMEVIQAKVNSLILKFIFLLLKRTLYMKKGKMILSALVLFVALGAAYAFNTKTYPGNLYYYNSDFSCVAAPCSTFDQGPANPCAVGTVYTDDGCANVHDGAAWVTECGIK